MKGYIYKYAGQVWVSYYGIDPNYSGKKEDDFRQIEVHPESLSPNLKKGDQVNFQFSWIGEKVYAKIQNQ